MKAILYTRHDEGVTVTYPTPEIFDVMSRGGYWSDRPRGFLQRQIEIQIADGIDPDHARRFAHAVQFGGLTTPEIYDVLKDRDCSRHGHSFDLIDPAADLPGRWFRDAWARGHNSGRVYIDLAKARLIQWERIEAELKNEIARRRAAKRKSPSFDRAGLQRSIRVARDAEELQKVWPVWN